MIIIQLNIQFNNLYCLNKLGSRKLYQTQISEKYKKTILQSYYEKYFSNIDFDWKSMYLLSHIIIVDTKLKVFQYKMLNGFLIVNKILLKLEKLESLLCSFCKAEDETYTVFYRCKKTSILWRQLKEFFSTGLDRPSISPQSVNLWIPRWCLRTLTPFKPHIANLQKLLIKLERIKTFIFYLKTMKNNRSWSWFKGKWWKQEMDSNQ